MPQIFEKLKNSGIKIKIYQQCHQEQTDKLSQFYKRAEIDYETDNFTDKILDYYLKVNLVITRSGASVLGELINIKLPFISIHYHLLQITINIKMLNITKKRIRVFDRGKRH